MVHGGKLKDLSSLNKRAEEFIDEFKQAQVHLAVLTWQQHNGDVWQPPSSTKYKFNFNAATCGEKRDACQHSESYKRDDRRLMV